MRTWNYPYRHEMQDCFWGQGPWSDEPDGAHWSAHGFNCLVIRNARYGHLCGYVGIERAHPYYSMDIHALVFGSGLIVHGGVTFAEKISERDIRLEELNVPYADLWFIGFDCSDPDRDETPFWIESCRREGIYDHIGVYRNFEYVTEQTELLAEQLLRKKFISKKNDENN